MNDDEKDLEKKIRLVPLALQDKLLNVKNKKYQLVFAILFHTGARVSEVVTLKWWQVDFQKQEIRLQTLKQRNSEGKKVFRTIPMTTSVLHRLVNYRDCCRKKDEMDYIFQGGKQANGEPSGLGHLSRQSVNRQLDRLTHGLVSPHDARHTFATRIVYENKNDIHVATALLGHSDTKTTARYLNTSKKEIKYAIDGLEKRGWIERMKRKYFPPKRVFVIPTEYGKMKFNVGRKNEMDFLYKALDKKINVLVEGEHGMGASHLLNNLKIEDVKTGYILRMDDVKRPTEFLKDLILAIGQSPLGAVCHSFFQELNSINERMMIDTDNVELRVEMASKFGTIVQKTSPKRLSEIAIQVSEPNYFTLIIDDMSNMTATGAKVLSDLKGHFHVIAASKGVKVEHTRAVSNFTKLKLKGLSTSEQNEMIEKVCLHLDLTRQVDDMQALKTHVRNNTLGNPLYILEHLERMAKEGNLDSRKMHKVRHTAGKQSRSLFLPVFVCLALLVVMRIAGKEFGGDDGAGFKFIGAFAAFALYMLRPLLRTYKKTTV